VRSTQVRIEPISDPTGIAARCLPPRAGEVFRSRKTDTIKKSGFAIRPAATGRSPASATLPAAGLCAPTTLWPETLLQKEEELA
jgi:hypothetical protein